MAPKVLKPILINAKFWQIEGAWNTDGRGLSIWDTFTHEHPELIADGSNADVGPDSYHYFEDDIKAIKSVGVSQVIIFFFVQSERS